MDHLSVLIKISKARLISALSRASSCTNAASDQFMKLSKRCWQIKMLSVYVSNVYRPALTNIYRLTELKMVKESIWGDVSRDPSLLIYFDHFFLPFSLPQYHYFFFFSALFLCCTQDDSTVRLFCGLCVHLCLPASLEPPHPRPHAATVST